MLGSCRRVPELGLASPVRRGVPWTGEDSASGWPSGTAAGEGTIDENGGIHGARRTLVHGAGRRIIAGPDRGKRTGPATHDWSAAKGAILGA